MDDLLSNALILVAVLGGLFLYHYNISFEHKRLPPGPRCLPVVGNAHQIPTERPWLVLSEWKKIYGDIIHLNVFGRSLVVVNSAKIAKDLLDKRSSIYSDRPHMVMAGELVGANQSFVLQPYDDYCRKQRRLIAQGFSPSMIPGYYPLQEKEAAVLVSNLLEDSASLVSEIQLRIGTIITRVTYGYYVHSAEDPILATPLAAVAIFSQTSTPGKFLVDFIPALKYLPRWMPGSGFLKAAEEWRQVICDAAWTPYEFCKKNLETGKSLMPNLCGGIIQEAGGKLSKDEEHSLVWTAITVMAGGSETTISSTLSFLRAMILYPRVQAKAQAELDAVISKDRLPSINDKSNLPYLRSIMMEVFRCGPALPLGIPHALTQDDIYEGFHLPKGALILPNVWHMLHDPEVFPNPEKFYPERFNGSDSEMAKVTDLLFGFGRRVCPGQYFAQGTLFAIIATTLATCDILPGLDENGKEVMPTSEYTPGTITFPEPFSLRLKLRSAQAAALLAEVSSAIE
ncbi:putative monooxygenase [Flammula alnicola]|nr:putative monooxygenase [Flammula alnicola]